MNIVFIAKTDLNTDGRIINELKILSDHYSNLEVNFLLFPDRPLKIDLGPKVHVKEIRSRFRNKAALRLLTVVDFTIRTLIYLFKCHPKIIHTQDADVVLPVLLYRLIKGRKFKLIYDDHEIPNENVGLFTRIFILFEEALMKRSDWVIFANQERMDILKKRHSLKAKTTYFLNLPYYSSESVKSDVTTEDKLKHLASIKKSGIKLLIHQGPLYKERGRKRLAEFSKILPTNYKILLVGGNEKDFEKFISEYGLERDVFCFIGSVNYFILPKFWDLADASIVMYLPTYINNRLCAPNRFYISIQKEIPVIVNKDNPVLHNFVVRYNCGVFIDDLNTNNMDEKLSFNKHQLNFTFEQLKQDQIQNFLSIYKDLTK